MQNKTANIKSTLKNNYLFILLSLFALGIVTWKYLEMVKVLPPWDAYSFLLNALTYAGVEFDYFEYVRGPFLPFVISLFFRAGIVHVNVIMAVDAAFAFIGALLLYLLVRQRYSQETAYMAGLFFICPMIMVDWIGRGYADITSVTLSIAAMLCFVRGIDNNPRWHLLSWPFLMMAFLARNTAALTGAPMLYYYIARNRTFDDLSWHAIGLFISGLVYLPVALFYYVRRGEPFYYLSSIFSGLSKNSDTTGSTGGIYDPSRSYYIDYFKHNFFEYRVHYILLILIVLGLLVLIVRYIRGGKIEFTGTFPVILFIGIFYYAFMHFSFLHAQLLLMLMMLLLLRYANKVPRGAFYGMLLLWMASYLLFHSLYYQKVVRYYIPMLPGFSSLAAISIFTFMDSIKKKVKRGVIPAGFLLLIVSCSLLYSAYISVGDTYLEPSRGTNADIIAVAEYLETSGLDYQDSLFYSDMWVYASWYLQVPVYPMPMFEENGLYGQQLQKYGVDYYITNRGSSFPGYTFLYKQGSSWLIKKSFDIDKPRFLYIGEAWENYLEPILEYKYYLIDGEKKIREWSEYIDDYSLDDLLSYDFVALYRFKWHDRVAAETLLTDYISAGGTLVIDCSGNNEASGYKLDGDVFLDTNIIRMELTSDSVIAPEEVREEYSFSSFVYGEDSWYGTTYIPVASHPQMYVYAYVDDMILLALETRGEGHILWMGYNYVFHTFDNMNTSEAMLLNEVFDTIMENETE